MYSGNRTTYNCYSEIIRKKYNDGWKKKKKRFFLIDCFKQWQNIHINNGPYLGFNCGLRLEIFLLFKSDVRRPNINAIKQQMRIINMYGNVSALRPRAEVSPESSHPQ